MAQIASSSKVEALFGARLPVLQAGMGGVAQPELAAAVCEAGAFGMIGLYRHTLDEIGVLLAQTATLTRARFGVNLVPFVLDADVLLDRLAFLADRPERPIVTFFGLPGATVLRALPAGMEYGVQGGPGTSWKRGSMPARVLAYCRRRRRAAITWARPRATRRWTRPPAMASTSAWCS